MQNKNLKLHDDLIAQKLNEVTPDLNLLNTSFNNFLLERKEKKKRRGLIWFFFFLFFLIGVGIIYFLSNQNESTNAETENKTISIIPLIDTSYAQPIKKGKILNSPSDNDYNRPDSNNLSVTVKDLLKETEIAKKKLDSNKNTSIYSIPNKNIQAYINKLDSVDKQSKSKLKPINLDSIAKKGTRVPNDTFYIVW